MLVVVLVLVAAAVYFRSGVFGRPLGTALVDGVPLADAQVSNRAATPVAGGNAGSIRDLWPPVPADARSAPLGTPARNFVASANFAFVATIPELDGRPVAWDPCRPIHLVVNGAQAPPNADRLLRDAIASVSSATGLQFVIDGATTESPADKRPALEKARYGSRWSPVLVAWTDPSTAPTLQGRVAGVAGPTGAPYFTAEQQHWVSGTVYLDGPQFREILRRGDGIEAARAIVMHEFGHLVGLDHVPAKDQLMYEKNVGQRTFGPGDREGLRQLGLGPCFTD